MPALRAQPTEPLQPVVAPSKSKRPALAKPRMYVERLHGVAVTDPYRWMETTGSAEVAGWVAAQKSYADQVLSEAPGQAEVLKALTDEFEATPTLEEVIPIADGVIFDRWLPAGHSYRVARTGAAERSLIEPGLLTKAGRSERIRAVIPSWDGKYVAVTATGRGDSAPQVSVVEVATGRLLPDLIPDLLTTTSGSRYAVTWLSDSTGFVYPRLAVGAASGPSVARLAKGRQHLHRLGTAQANDRPIFGFGVSPDVAFAPNDLPASIVMAPSSPWVLATASRVKSNTSELWAARLDQQPGGALAWRKIGGDGLRQARLRGDRVFAIADGESGRGELVSLDLAQAKPEWRTELPAQAGVLRNFVLARDALYFTEYRDGVTHLARVDFASGKVQPIAVPLAGDLRFAPHDPSRDTPWIKAQSWTDPGAWFRAPPGITSAEASTIDPGGRQTDQRRFVTRHLRIRADDGQLVPVSLVHLSDLKLDGTTPLLLEAYGGYGKVQAPAYNPSIATWVRQGAIYAYAHVRGGGELGANWRKAALRERKIRSSRDLIAVAKGLIDLRYTGRGRIAVMGLSSGAQMPGLAIATDPGLFGAAIFDVGQPDEIRGAQLDPTAARNLAEMGDIDSAEGIRLLQQVSPYHRVPTRTDFPAVIVKSGADDYNFGSSATDAKYVARLQAANAGPRPIIWLNVADGHSSIFGNDPAVAAQAIAFMLWQTGHPGFQPRP